MGGCQNYGSFSGTLNIRCRIKIGIQKGDHNFDNRPFAPRSHRRSYSPQLPKASQQFSCMVLVATGGEFVHSGDLAPLRTTHCSAIPRVQVT